MSEQNERAHFVWRPVRSDQYSRVLSSPSHCCINSQKSHKLTDLANGLMKNPARRAGSPPEVSAQFQLHPLLRIVHDWSAVWFKEGDLLHFYDLLAAVAIFSPEVCRYASGTVNVELDDPKILAVTHFEPVRGTQINIASDIVS